MKNLKRVLCLMLIALIAIVPLASYAAEAGTKQFSDVAKDSKFTEAIYTLVDMGIIKGDAGADTFRPDASISREEFSVILTRFLGAENLITNVTEYPFTDVTPETCADWSIKAIKIAYDMGLVSGYGDETFGPKDSVTYEQVIKTIVCALGYEKNAIKFGGWPTGYITVAINNKVTEKAEYANSEPAPRAIVAQLIYNALTVKTANDNSTGSNVQTTILEDKLKLYEGKGVINANSQTSLNEKGNSLNDGQVEIGFSDDNIFEVGETNAESLLGSQVKYYYKETNDEKILVSARPTASNKTYTFDKEYIRSDSLTGNSVEIYNDPKGDLNDYKEYTLASPVYYIYNGKFTTSPVIPTIGTVTLIDYNSDNKYEIVDIKDTKIFVVNTIDLSNNKIFDLITKDYLLTTENQRVDNITKNGVNVSLDTVKKNDVLLVTKSNNASGKKTLDVKIVTNTVTGVVSSKNDANQEYVIGGKTYETEDIYNEYAISKNSLPNIDDKVTAYIGDNGKIVYMTADTTTANANYAYAYLIGINKKNSLTSKNFQVKLLGANGKIGEYNLASKVKINGETYSDVTETANALNVNSTLVQNDGKADSTSEQLIKYAVNSSGDISIILTVDPDQTNVSSKYIANELTISRTFAKANYSSTSKALGSVLIDDNTKIFVIPTDRAEDDFQVIKSTSLRSNASYDCAVFDISDGVAKAVTIFGADTSIGSEDDKFVIISKITSKYDAEAGETNVNISGFDISGKSVSYVTDGEKVDSSIINDLAIGDIVKISIGISGKASKVQPVFSPSTGDNGTTYKDSANKDYSYRQSGNNQNTTDAEEFTIYGTVNEIFETSMTVFPNKFVEENTLEISEKMTPVKFGDSVCYYIFNSEKKEVKAGSRGDIADFATTESDSASKVFVFMAYGKTKLVYINK